jgi:hypothetical protein
VLISDMAFLLAAAAASAAFLFAAAMSSWAL